ncbi:MAG: hypothetical protein QG597_944, partial [Actinomycetota bacterium]|nr:hypothetical protein [Actinomycetota bacterium]
MMRDLFARLDPRRPTGELPPLDGAEVDARLVALGRAAEVATGRLPAQAVAPAQELVARAAERRRLSDQLTVVALAGSTGAGKSTLFNSVLGAQVAAAGVLRPTTSEPLAAIWQESAEAQEMLAWLGVSRWHVADGASEALADLILIDLPDHDSTHAAHRAQVDRLVARVDVMIWVLDPQKYADALVHDEYLTRFAHHSEVTVVVLNQVDRLTVAEADACVAHLRRLVDADGLPDARVIAASARSGQGLDEIAGLVADAVAGRRASVARVAADVAGAAAALARAADDDDGAPVAGAGAAEVERLTDLLTDASGAGIIAEAVADSRNLQAAAAVGWPPLRWLSRLRPDPVARLRLDRPGVDPALVRTSMPSNDPVALARAQTAVLTYADAASRGAPPAWIASARDVADAAAAGLPDELDRAITRAPLVSRRTPRWWSLVGALQWLLLALAVAGGVWLLALAGLSYLQFDLGPAPKVEGFPIPTLMLIVGLLGGVVLAAIAR